MQQEARDDEVLVEPVVTRQRQPRTGRRNRVLQQAGTKGVVHCLGRRGNSESPFDLRIGKDPEQQLFEVCVFHSADQILHPAPQHIGIDRRRTNEKSRVDRRRVDRLRLSEDDLGPPLVLLNVPPDANHRPGLADLPQGVGVFPSQGHDIPGPITQRDREIVAAAPAPPQFPRPDDEDLIEFVAGFEAPHPRPLTH